MSADRVRLTAALALVVGLGCHGGRDASQDAKRRDGGAGARAATRYRAGDFVVYRYSGSALREPATLREEVLAQDGDRLVIDVVATRGEERRHWQQVVTDTEENQANNVVDELWVFDGEERRRVANEKNAELYRLYEWTVLVPDGKARDVKSAPASVGFAGAMHPCERASGANQWRGRAIRFESYDCADFLWTHGPARFWDEKTNETLLKVDVVRAGHEPRCDYGVAATTSTCGEAGVCAFVEAGRSACVPFAVANVELLAPFRAGRTFACTQGARSKAGRSHSFAGDIFAVDLAPVAEVAGVEVVAPVAGEAFVFDRGDERDDGPAAHNSSRCGLGYGNHVKIWDGTTIVLLAHLARVRPGLAGPVRRGDVLGVAGVSGAAGHRHVHVTVTRPLPGDDVRALLVTPGFKGAVPVKWKLLVASPSTSTSTSASKAMMLDELRCNDEMSRAAQLVAAGP